MGVLIKELFLATTCWNTFLCLIVSISLRDAAALLSKEFHRMCSIKPITRLIMAMQMNIIVKCVAMVTTATPDGQTIQ